MVIICLGWGSLIWDPRELPVHGSWQRNGPLLPIEFARQSQDDRITLVCVPGFPLVQSLWIRLKSITLDEACEALRERENISRKRIDQDIGVWVRDQLVDNGSYIATIAAWATSLGFDAVIWTNLQPKFRGDDRRIPTIEEVLEHLTNLTEKKREKAEQYIRMTPRQIQTEYRVKIENVLKWLPDQNSFD